jgi:sugar lactone lactonase YvrE
MRTRSLSIVVALLTLCLMTTFAAAQSVSFAGTQTTVPASGLSFPGGVAVDGAGDVFIADTNDNRVVEVPAGGGPQTTVGSGLYYPYGVAVDGAGDVFIADYLNSRVVEVPVGGGPQTTVGIGLRNPVGVAVDRAGDIFIADSGNSRVVEVPAGGGPQTTVPASGLNFPTGVAVDGAGNVFIADYDNSRVVEVPAGGGPQTTVGSGLSNPVGVAVDGAGDVFIADTNNNRVVEVPAGGGPQITVGSGLNSPFGVAVDGAGDVFIADIGNTRVLEVQPVAVNFGSANICPGAQTTPAPCSQTFTLNYNVAAPATFGTINVVTQGAPNLDFTMNSTTCTGTQTSGSSCAVVVSFAPRAPGLRMGAVQLTDNLGNVLVTTLIHGEGQGPAIAFGPGTQTTMGSSLSVPTGVAVDGAGNVFIADTLNNRVVKVPAGGGAQTTLGSGLNNPYGVAVDGAGDVFIADTLNNRVVEVPAGGGIQTTVGSGLSSPYDVAVDGAGNVFIADTSNNRVVEVPAIGGAQTTVGSGLSAPYAVAVDGAGDVFIADHNNHRVVEVPAIGGAQTTVGSGLSDPFGVAVDGAGDVFISDLGTQQIVEIPAGGGAQTAVVSGLNFPYGVAVDAVGDILIADAGNNRVLQVQRSQPLAFSFAATAMGSTSTDSPQSVTVENIGNQLLAAVAPGLSVGANFVQVAGSGTPADCTSSFSLAPGASCNLSVSFMPQTLGSVVGVATFTDNALNTTAGSQSFTLRGTATQESQTISFGALSNQALGTASYTLSATASSGLAVSFTSTTPAVCTVSGATVTLVTAGTCAIQATQPGNTNYSAATAINQNFQVIHESETITFGALSNQVLGTAPFTLSASASSGLTVSFASTTPAVCTVSGATGTPVAAGTCNIQATQTGNSSYGAATPVSQSFQISDFTLTSSSTTMTVTAGQPAMFTLTVMPQGSFTSTIRLACIGLPAMAGCTFTSATLTPNASTVTTALNITTAAHTTALALPPSDHRSSPLYAIWLLLPAMFLGTLGMAAPKGRKLLSYCFVFLLVGGCLLQVACGGGASPGVNTVNTTTGTPAGTYSVIVSGTAGSNQHTTTIKLTVH